MRYYYEDPLAAAWMSERHNMRFDGQGEAYAGPFIGAWRSSDRMNGRPARFYIHPDSLHLLEPQEGDLVNDNTLYTRPIIRKIIQRNGVPFMWPKIEEADNG